MGREIINPDGMMDPTEFGFSQGIVAGETFYVSGQTPRDPEGNIVGDDVTEQSRIAFENVRTLLADVDKGLEDVAKVTTYLLDPYERLEDFLGVWDTVFDEPYPCHTVVGVEQLAREAYLVELEVEVPLAD